MDAHVISKYYISYPPEPLSLQQINIVLYHNLLVTLEKFLYSGLPSSIVIPRIVGVLLLDCLFLNTLDSGYSISGRSQVGTI
jgi:hypothetical protein